MAAEKLDGRRRRAQDNRTRIIAAMLELVREGELTPGAEKVAQRAGVGLRTVFRLFKDMDGVYAEMATAIEAELATVLALSPTGATWRERLEQIVRLRAQAFEAAAPYRRAADANRHRSPYLQRRQQRLADELRAALLVELPETLRGQPDVVEALDALLSFETWMRLRREQRLSPARARAVLVLAIARLTDGV